MTHLSYESPKCVFGTGHENLLTKAPVNWINRALELCVSILDKNMISNVSYTNQTSWWLWI